MGGWWGQSGWRSCSSCVRRAYRFCRVCDRWLCRACRVGAGWWVRCLECSPAQLEDVRREVRMMEREDRMRCTWCGNWYRRVPGGQSPSCWCQAEPCTCCGERHGPRAYDGQLS